MRSGNSFEAIPLDELIRNVLAEGITCTAGTDTPSGAVVWVRPEQVTHGSLVRYLNHTIDTFDLVEGVQTWGETTVEAENLVLNHSSQWQVVK